MDIEIASAVARLLPGAFGVAKKVWTEIDQALDNSIRSAHIDYATNVIKKNSYAKTFLIRSSPAYLYDFYVPASVEPDRTSRVEHVDISKLYGISKRLIITGNGGSGKSILMRHLLLDALSKASKFPVLIELRNLNDEDSSLEDEIVNNLASNGFDLDKKYIEKSLKEGIFVLLLDGFDEVIKSKRLRLEREVRNLVNATDCQIVITSRHDASLQSWSQFTNVRISNLTLDEACDLVGRINFDVDTKANFLTSLRSGLFESHRFFLSNPLLLSIMLLTYGESANIPKRISSFYLQAYEALFHGHDALKSSFKRERATELDIYEFARLFSAFSILTFEDRAFRFSKTIAVKYIRKSIEITGVNKIAPEDFLNDARQAVCLLVEDGLELAFIHRSFQEYFAARFIVEADEQLQKKLIQRLTQSGRNVFFEVDKVVSLVHEMSPIPIERYFLIPGLSSFFLGHDKRRVDKKFWLEAFKKNFSQILRDVGSMPMTFVIDKNSKSFQLIGFVFDKYVKKKVSADEWDARARGFVNKHVAENSLLKVKDLEMDSDVTNDLCQIHYVWSVDGLESVRKILRDMRKRVSGRGAAIDRIFQF